MRCHRIIIIASVVVTILSPVDSPARHSRASQATRASAAVGEKRSQLARLRLQIAAYEKQLHTLEHTEHSSLRKLDAYSRQTTLLRTFIANLNDEERRLSRDIDETQKEIFSSEQQLRELKSQYARAVVALYKRGTQSDLELLLTANGMGEAVERTEYLRRFSEARARLAENIQSTVGELREQQTSLTAQRDEKAATASEKEQQQQYLATQAAQRSALIEKIRNDKSSLKETLTRAKESSKQIESIIGSLVARERAKRKQTLASRGTSRTAPDKIFDDVARSSRDEENSSPVAGTRTTEIDATGFGALRGALHWPCNSHRIAEHFGEHTHPTLGTVTENLGVDIHAPKNSDVVAVSAGTVSLVYWLPSYGTIVILDHQGGYRTVYANLAEVNVKQGEQVRAQQLVGHSDASAEAGEVVHFEIWKDREKLNPESWLARR